MILVDSTVWIDYFRGTDSPRTGKLDSLLGNTPLAVGDLIVTEVLQGFPREREFNEVRTLFLTMDIVVMGGLDNAIAAAHNIRHHRRLGVTVRKTIDTIIATRCIVDGYELLHDDRDFEPFETYLGLRTVDCGT
jgi:predicted nucleic acid-binding protein